MKIKVLLAVDRTLFRQGLRSLISVEPGMEVVGEVADASAAVAQARQVCPDVVLIDIGMAGMSGFEATRLIRKDRPETRVVFLSMYDDEECLVEYVEAGASGFLLKDCPVDQLLTSIREVHRGGSYLSPRLITRLIDSVKQEQRADEQFGALTKRELEVLKMLAEGYSQKKIATVLGIKVKTVDVHKYNLMRKLDIHNKAQLVQYAIQKKIVRPAVVKEWPERKLTLDDVEFISGHCVER